MSKIVYAQTIIEENKLDDLKNKSGKEATKDALMEAIDHYLTCSGVGKGVGVKS